MVKERSPETLARQAPYWLIVTTLLWGGSFVFNKIGFREIPPITFMALRFSLATLLLGIFCLWRRRRPTLVGVRKGAAVGIALAGANLTFVLGVSGTTISRAGFLNNLFVLIVPIVCLALWRSRIDRATWAGVLLAIAGLGWLAGGGVAGFSRGDLFSVICAFFISLHIVLVSRLLREVDLYLVTLVQFATVAVIGVALALLIDGPPAPFGPVSAAALGYCVIFPTIICFTLQNAFQPHTTPTQAGLIYTLDPIWSLLGGVLLLGERLSLQEWSGCLLIFLAVLLPLLVRVLPFRRGPLRQSLPVSPILDPESPA